MASYQQNRKNNVMSTRNVTMVVHRSEAEKYKSGFAIHPSEISDKSYEGCIYTMMVTLNIEL